MDQQIHLVQLVEGLVVDEWIRCTSNRLRRTVEYYVLFVILVAVNKRGFGCVAAEDERVVAEDERAAAADERLAAEQERGDAEQLMNDV